MELNTCLNNILNPLDHSSPNSPKNSQTEPRVRSINFTAHEKKVLTSLIAAHPSISNKYCDNGSLSAKHISWSDVYEKFCAAFPIQPLRDIKQLKGCWKRLKMKRRMYPYEPQKWYGSDEKSTDLQHLNQSIIVNGDSPTGLNSDMNIEYEKLTSDIKLKQEMVESANVYSEDPTPSLFENGLNIKDENIGGSRINHVATTLQQFLAKHANNDANNDHVVCLPKEPTQSRRKLVTPRRLSIRPQPSYLKPPMTPISPPVDSNNNPEEHMLTMAKREHEAKMRILRLKEWKLRHECIQLNIGLPPNYVPLSDNEQDSS